MAQGARTRTACLSALAGAVWPPRVQGMCPAGRSALGLFGPQKCTKTPYNAMWALRSLLGSKIHHKGYFGAFFRALSNLFYARARSRQLRRVRPIRPLLALFSCEKKGGDEAHSRPGGSQFSPQGVYFKVFTCDTLLRSVRKGGWFTSRDVRDTEDRLYQYAVLPS